MPVSPPRPKGPGLNALRAFEAAARLGGFKAAAEELHITPGAISQQIKQLEQWAGTSLFERKSQGVSVTNAGKAVAPILFEAFDKLGEATQVLKAHSKTRTIHIAALPGIAQLWLPRRIASARDKLGDIQISITALERPPVLNRETFDMGVFIGQPASSDNYLIIEPDLIFPVCHPEIAQRLECISDLSEETLLYDTRWKEDWNLWARESGTALFTPASGPGFSLYSIAVEEALSGSGVLMGHLPLVRPMLERGELVAPFEERVETDNFLYISHPPNLSDSSPVGEFLRLLNQ